MSCSKFTESRTAKIRHDCSRCGGSIDRGDTYLRMATPPWYSGDYFWIVLKVCYDCQGMTKQMNYLDAYR